jgi:hypothetical protein
VSPASVESYVHRLERELRRRFVNDATILEEVRGHLTDAVERGTQRGRSAAEAREEAIARFGTPETVAAAFAADRFRTLHLVLLVAAIACGLAIAYVDSRPTWNDTGITAGTMSLGAAALGLAGPRRPWLWALGVGIWIPAYALVRAPSPGALSMLIVLVFPLAGAYLGMALRRAIMPSLP